MSERLTNILGYLTLAAIMAAIWIMFGEDPTREQGARGELTFAGLSERINEAASITISAGDASVTLTKEADIWRVGERTDFPADEAKVRTFLRGFALSERREPKTANPDRFNRLGLGAGATSVTLTDDTDGRLLSVQVGTRKQNNSGRSLTYVFQETDTRAWLVSGLAEMNTDPVDWLNKDILNINEQRFASIMVNDALLVRALGEAEYVLQGTGDSEAAPAWKRAEVARAVAVMRAEDVEHVANPLSDPTGQVVAKTHDGLVLTLTLYDYRDAAWVQIAATFDASLRDSGAAGELVGAPVDGALEAANINARTNGWLFKISDMDADKLKQRKPDFVETTETNATPS